MACEISLIHLLDWLLHQTQLHLPIYPWLPAQVRLSQLPAPAGISSVSVFLFSCPAEQNPHHPLLWIPWIPWPTCSPPSTPGHIQFITKFCLTNFLLFTQSTSFTPSSNTPFQATPVSCLGNKAASCLISLLLMLADHAISLPKTPQQLFAVLRLKF